MKKIHAQAKTLTGTFFFLIALTTHALASSNLKIAAVQGDVHITPAAGGTPVAAERGAALADGDVIRTGPDSIAVIEVTDYGKLSVASNTEFKIEKSAIEDKIVKSQFRLLIGSVKGDLKKLPKGSSFKIATNTAVMGVRGTSFLLSVNTVGETLTYVEHGQVDVEATGNGEVSQVNSGEASQTTVAGSQSVDPGAMAESFEAIAGQEATAESGGGDAEVAEAGGESQTQASTADDISTGAETQEEAAASNH